MKAILFNENWTVREKDYNLLGPVGEAKSVTLPYDVMIFTATDKNAVSGSKSGYFKSGSWEYTKKFEVPADYSNKHIVFRFDGVFNRSMVYINGDYAGGRVFGYSQFFIDADRFLKYGEENEIKVVVHTEEDERWYTGAGIYRDAYMLVSDLARIEPNGIKVTASEITGNSAIAGVSVQLKNGGLHTKTVRVKLDIRDVNGNCVANTSTPVTVFSANGAVSHSRLYISNPILWSAEEPKLYTLAVTLVDETGNVLDEANATFGIRSLRLDVESGLRVNGQKVKLRGACVHHDNGLIGAVSTFDVECRKVKKLKEAGFNAIRTAHNPASPAFLDACDFVGMYVLEESFDVWTANKSNFDYANDFAAHWEEDIESLVGKSFNHPSVIIYSIGNEIGETGSAAGSVWGRKIAEKIRSLDSARYITNAISGMMSCLPALMKAYAASAAAAMQGAGTGSAQTESATGQKQGGEVNTVMTNMGDRMKMVMLSEIVTKMTEESYGYTDIAGYNYMDLRYDMDKELFPNRIIVGTESFAAEIDTIWEKVRHNSKIIGDFAWSGWDYIGEAGIGDISYESDIAEDRANGVYTDYPFMTAMCGDISVCGYRRPASYYREIVFGLRKTPYIAVDRPEHFGKTAKGSPWIFSDALENWNFSGFEGKPVRVNVYADADEVELFVNGKSAGKKIPERFKCVFDTVYVPGSVKAVAYKNGEETGAYSVATLPEDFFEIRAEETSVKTDGFAFVNIRAAKNLKVKILVEGAGELFAFGTDDPKTTELFSDSERTLYDGRALAVIRGIDEGEAIITASAEGLGEKKLTLPVRGSAKSGNLSEA